MVHDALLLIIMQTLINILEGMHLILLDGDLEIGIKGGLIN
jgi:hypothetical protein